MRRGPRLTLVLLGTAVAVVPVAVFVTIFLYPLWSWIEETTGIESVGHSGPADWCYVSVYVLLLLGAGIFAIYDNRPKQK